MWGTWRPRQNAARIRPDIQLVDQESGAQAPLSCHLLLLSMRQFRRFRVGGTVHLGLQLSRDDLLVQSSGPSPPPHPMHTGVCTSLSPTLIVTMPATGEGGRPPPTNWVGFEGALQNNGNL